MSWWKFWETSTPETLLGTSTTSKAPGNVGQPVQAIVASFTERGRWVTKFKGDPYDLRIRTSFTATDKVTGEEYYIASNGCIWHYVKHNLVVGFPVDIYQHTLPTWLTQVEKEYVFKVCNEYAEKLRERIARIEDRKRKRSEAQSAKNQAKERARLMAIYCKGEE